LFQKEKFTIMSTDIKKKLIFAILQHLKSEQDASTKDDDKESLGVAVDCLSNSFGVSLNSNDDKEKYQLPSDTDLLKVFCLGLANYEQIANALANSTSQSSPKPFEDATREKQYQEFEAILVKQGYFKGTEKGSDEYNKRCAKAREKFLLKKQQPTTNNTEKVATPSTHAPTLTAESEISFDDQERAESFKNRGNKLLQQKKFDKAVKEYQKAINLNPYNAIYHSNKAAALLHLQKNEDAVEAALQATQVDPTYAKGWARLGSAHVALQQPAEALSAYREAAKADVDNESYKSAINGLKTKLRAAGKAVVDEPEDQKKSTEVKSNDNNSYANAAKSAPGAGAEAAAGMPDLASMFGPGGAPGGLSAMLQNPQMMQMAQNLMSNPEAMAGLMNNPMLQQMAQNPNLANMFGNAGAGAPADEQIDNGQE